MNDLIALIEILKPYQHKKSIFRLYIATRKINLTQAQRKLGIFLPSFLRCKEPVSIQQAGLRREVNTFTEASGTD